MDTMLSAFGKADKVIFDSTVNYKRGAARTLEDDAGKEEAKAKQDSSVWLAQSCGWRQKHAFICSMTKARYEFLQTAALQLRDYGFAPIGNGYENAYDVNVNPAVYPLKYHYLVENFVEETILEEVNEGEAKVVVVTTTNKTADEEDGVKKAQETDRRRLAAEAVNGTASAAPATAEPDVGTI